MGDDIIQILPGKGLDILPSQRTGGLFISRAKSRQAAAALIFRNVHRDSIPEKKVQSRFGDAGEKVVTHTAHEEPYALDFLFGPNPSGVDGQKGVFSQGRNESAGIEQRNRESKPQTTLFGNLL
jgi:hypothetical protein